MLIIAGQRPKPTMYDDAVPRAALHRAIWGLVAAPTASVLSHSRVQLYQHSPLTCEG